jgi:isopentenyldiphosphate isomerase
MKESLDVYSLEGEFLGAQDRDEFYSEMRQEFLETGSVTKKVKTIKVFLLTTEGRIYLQKRSKTKKENPGLYDKTVGGHVVSGDSFALTVVKECAEELGFPATILEDEDFSRAIKSVDLQILGVLKKIDHIANSPSVRMKADNTTFPQMYIDDVYLGYYDGAIRFSDGESSGIETFSLLELECDIAKNPDKFTEDLKGMVLKYKDLLVAVDK